MKYRVASSCLLLGSMTVMACDSPGDGFDYGGYRESEIVFGIDQVKAADGKVTASIGYEMLDVLGHGSFARGVVTATQSCWAETLDDRLGQPKVAGGVATFTGAELPANGAAVIANRVSDLALPGAAWSKPGESVSFTSTGFAMPDIGASQLDLPSPDLALLTPADAASTVALAPGQDITVAWTPSDANAPQENVVVSLTATPDATPNARGVELRCFFDRAAGTGTFPQRIVDRFAELVGTASGAVMKGKLAIATHRQLTIFADGGWTVYVVATASQREQPFTLQR